jgi:aspartate racemase
MQGMSGASGTERGLAVRVAEGKERDAAFALRIAVFCDEQGVPRDAEIDEHEDAATHVVALEGGRVIGTMRWRPICGGARAKIERVAVASDRRGRGIGAALMQFALARLDAMKLKDTVLHAQVHARAFYESLGYVAEGEPFEEDGILHIGMRRKPGRPRSPMRRLGLLGGMSWESTALYYRQLNDLARERLGGLHSAPLLLWSFDFAQIAEHQHAGDWAGAAALLVDAARRVHHAGAEALVLCTNTMHKLADEVQAAVPIPLVHIADATAEAVRRGGSQRPALLATAFTMEQDFYVGRMRERYGIGPLVPDPEGRALVHRIIYEELCRGIVRPESKAACLDQVRRLRERGADGVILGCTEVTMLIGQADVDLPVFDSTRLHVEAAMAFALGAETVSTTPA